MSETAEPFLRSNILAAAGSLFFMAVLIAMIASNTSTTTQLPVITPLAVRWENPTPPLVDRLEFDPAISAEPLQESTQEP